VVVEHDAPPPARPEEGAGALTTFT
jgi:hypothetical protein